MKNQTLHPSGARALALVLALALAGCGGGGGNPGTAGGSGSTGSGGTGGTGTGGTGGGTGTTAKPTATLAFATAGGQASNALTGATPLTAKATVLDAAGKPVPNALVTFATDNSLAVFSPSAGTALTDANGVASVTMRTASLAAAGAGKVTVTSSVAGTTVTGESNYSVGATTLTFGTLSAASSSIQAYGSTMLAVDVFAGGAKYTAQQVNVHFSSACVAAGKATLAATVATNNGTAQAVYRDQGCGNDDVITASADGVPQSVTGRLAIAAPAPASVQFLAASPTDKSIVIQGQGGINRTETATLKFRVFDVFGNPLAGKQVNFSVSNPSVVHLNKDSDSTDQNGEVITTVNSGLVATTFRVQATLPGTAAYGKPDISTTSDSIVVTTGLPVQRAFSLSVDTFNVEGWNYDSGTDKPAAHVQVMLADTFGNPVPDGTPVVFQTNMGSVGSSNKGGCNTVNGGCVVDFRTQNPRLPLPNVPATPCNTGTGPLVSDDSTRRGVATVCASSTDGTNTVFGKIALFFSGGSADNVFMDTGVGGVVKLPMDSKPVDLGTVKSDEAKVFRLQFNDANLNPMPAGSVVAVTSVVNAKADAPLPDKVPNIFPHSAAGLDDITGGNISGTQGYFHTFSISSTQPKPCTAPANASFSVTVTSPTGLSTIIPFKLSFSCP
jgi:protocatechuate 3,4-dioxygenase beta subunit